MAAEDGRTSAAAFTALSALALSGWVAFTLVPVLARRTPLRWLAYRIDYRVTREGIVYLAGIFIIALAALNTGNNLLFMMLACLLAGILISGVLSQIVLSGMELRLDLPEHIFAGQPVMALAEFINHKLRLPSFSLRLVGTKGGAKGGAKAGAARRGKSKAARRRPATFSPCRSISLTAAAATVAAGGGADLPAARRLPPGSSRTANQISLRFPGENAAGGVEDGGGRLPIGSSQRGVL